MKKRLLSVFLSFCMILTLLPATALATDADSEGVATAADTLAAAFNKEGGEPIAVANGDTVTLQGSYTTTGTEVAVPEGVTLVIAEGATLTVLTDNFLEACSGTIRVEYGGTVVAGLDPLVGTADKPGSLVPQDSNSYIELQMAGITSGDATIVIHGNVEMPDGKYLYLQSRSSGTKHSMNMEIPNGSKLTVNGELIVISGQSGEDAEVTIAGELDASNGIVTALSARGHFSVEDSGILRLGSLTGEVKPGTTKDGKITIEPGGLVYADTGSDVKEAQLAPNGTLTHTTIGSDTVYYIEGYGPSSEVTDPGTEEPEEPVAPQAGIVVAGADGKEISGSYTTVDEALNALNAQTNDKSGKITLLDRGEGDDTYTLTSSTLAAGQIIEVQSGATLKVNAGLTVSGTLTVNGTITTGESVTITLAEGGTMTVPTGNDVAPVAAEGFELVTDATTTSGVTAYSVKAAETTEPGGEGGETEEPDPEEPPVVTEPENPVSNQDSFEDALAGDADTVTIVPNEEPEAEPVVITISTTNVSIGDKTIVVTNNTSLVLGDVETVQEVLSGTGSLKIETGGTLYLPASLFTTQTPAARALLNTLSVGADPVAPLADENRVAFVGTSDDAYIKLSEGAAAEIVGNKLVISGGTATVNKTLDLAYMTEQLGLEKLEIVLTSNATMGFNGTARLTTSEKNPITVESGSTLNVPLLSAAEAAAMAGNINLEAGAKVTYVDLPVLAQDSAMITLTDSATATMNVADGALTLKTGKASIAYDGEVKAVLKLAEDAWLPLNITIAKGAELEIPENKHLSIRNNSTMTVEGTVSVAGSLDIHSAAKAAGTGSVAVSGELNLLGSKENVDQQANVSVPIAISGSGKVTVAPERATGYYITSTITGGVPVTDGDGNVTYQQRTGITVTKADGTEINPAEGGSWTIQTALAETKAAHIYLNANKTDYETAYELDTSSTIGANQTLHVQSGATLEVKVASSADGNYPLLTGSEGWLEIQAGGTVKLPKSASADSDLDTWIGTSTDTNARLQLTSGTATFDFEKADAATNKVGTLTINGAAVVPTGVTTFLHLGLHPIDVVIEENASVTVNGLIATVDALDSLDGAANSTITVNGALTLPQMSKAEMANIKGDITINGGATVKYNKWTIVGEDALIDLTEDASATLNVSEANTENGNIALTLNTGSAEIVGADRTGSGGASSQLLAALVSSDDGLVPFDITIAENAALTVPAGTTLTLTQNGGLTSNGITTVEGTLDLHNNIKLGGTITVSGTSAKVTFTGDDITGSPTLALTNGAAESNISWPGGVKPENVTVTGGQTEPETVPVTSVALDKTTATIKVGGTVTLAATITPADATNKNVTWSSSDPAVATVDTNGVVTGKAAGKATITVTTVDGNHTATCVVTVTTSGGGGSSGGGGGGGSSSSGYTITVEDTDHGSIRVSPSRASRGDTVTITVDPDTGYELDTLIVRDSNGDRIDVERQSDTRYTFEMPSRRVTVEATFVEITEEPVPSGLPFTDVHTGDWFYDAVEYAYENGMMDGIGNNLFSPNGTTTRAMIVTILHRLENQPASGSSIFTDVPAGQWYTNAVAWAAANGIVDGYGDGRFGPNDTITREQMAAILYRYAQFKGYDVSNTGNLSGYTDAAQVSEWARTAMGWANAQGLITGNTATTLNPTGSATRAEVATILMRFVENVAK